MSLSSNILIVTLGSLHQLEGGTDVFKEQDSVLSRLPADSQSELIDKRARAFRWLKKDKTAQWQGIPITDHEYNKQLVCGREFGGNDKGALYLPALERFRGEFYLALEAEGRQAASQSQHHILLLCGLYGVSALKEPIQRYNCPVRKDLGCYDIWTRDDDTTTNILLSYIEHNKIARVLNLAATGSWRGLVAWPTIHDRLRGNVLHCFSAVGAGDDALIPFGRLMVEFLLGASADRLLDIKPETEESGILFRDIDAPRSGMPHEVELRKWNQADEIDRKRRGIIRFLDKAEGDHGTHEGVGNRIARLKLSGKINYDEAKAMQEINTWRNRIIYDEDMPDKTALSQIKKAWEILSRQVRNHKWKIDEF